MSIVRPLLKSLPKLPAPALWSGQFKGSKTRVSVMTEEIAGSHGDLPELVEVSHFRAERLSSRSIRNILLFASTDLAAQKIQIGGRSIIELYPGPGQLTRSMLLAGANKIMTVDNGDTYQSSLQALVDSSQGRIHHLPWNPISDPYDELVINPKNQAIPGLKTQPWDKVHSELMIVGSLPDTTLGEKVLVDLMLASMERIGIFSLGRIEMFMFCNKDTVKRLLATPGSVSRHKVAVYTEGSSTVTSIMRPGRENFHFPSDYELIHVVPHEKPKLETNLEIADYCLRNLFGSRSHPLNKVIKLLGPGAEILLGRLSFDTSIRVKYMTIEQLNEVAVKFAQWPLRPTILYDEMISEYRKR
ncbi:Dimethyladenosine transferase 1, mitochondrial [Mortierella sp. NVP85]|nr:Dimethyladenosine transferase 1, mitochondrial [Mortierella sp. NVP85]